MKLTLQLKLLPSPQQAEALRRTTESFNDAATHVAWVGFQSGSFDRNSLHRLCYREIRDTFGLSAQLAVRAIGKATEVFKRDKTRLPVFRKDGALVYDPRCYGFKGPALAPAKETEAGGPAEAAMKQLGKDPEPGQGPVQNPRNIFRVPANADSVSLLTDTGRLRVPLSIGQHQRNQLSMVRGQADLVKRNGHWFLNASMEVPEAEMLQVPLGFPPVGQAATGAGTTGAGTTGMAVSGDTLLYADGTPVSLISPLGVEHVLGVDLGVANLAVTSDDLRYSGDQVEAVRVRRLAQRQSLQRAATRRRKGRTLRRRKSRKGEYYQTGRTMRPKSINRKLKRLSGREARFRRDVNHCISKQIVKSALDTNRVVAVEDLKGIRSRIRFSKPQRARMGSWGFGQLLMFLAYKARRAGVPLESVRAAYTSQICSRCGNCAKENRPTQARFRCTACGYSAHADFNAALNIAARAAVNRLKVSIKAQQRLCHGQGQAVAFTRRY